jgi:hypothetical protein
MSRLARAFTCTSLLLAAAAGASDAGPASARGASKAELELARTPELYLVVDAAGRWIEIKVRGLVLERVEPRELRVFVRRPLLGRAAARGATWPPLLTVRAAPAGLSRPVLTPEELRPYREDEPARPAVTPELDRPPPPAACEAPLAEGGLLRIGTKVDRVGAVRAFLLAVWAGARRLFGRPGLPSPVLAVAVDPDDGRRLCRLLQPGTRILVAAE